MNNLKKILINYRQVSQNCIWKEKEQNQLKLPNFYAIDYSEKTPGKARFNTLLFKYYLCYTFIKTLFVNMLFKVTGMSCEFCINIPKELELPKTVGFTMKE